MNEIRPIDANALDITVSLYMAENAYLNDTALDVLKKVAKWLEEEPPLDLAPKWISVKDRLPPHQGKKVLVINGHGDVRIYALWKREYGNKWTWIDENGKFNHVNNITHWMPLPESPKEAAST